MCINPRFCFCHDIFHPFLVRQVIGQRRTVTWHCNIVFFKKLRIESFCQYVFVTGGRGIEDGSLNHQLFRNNLHNSILPDKVGGWLHRRLRRTRYQQEQRHEKTELDYFFHGGKSTNKIKKRNRLMFRFSFKFCCNYLHSTPALTPLTSATVL